ncbi:Glycosyltransferase involved in cell wall bisynthesis [Chitinophaga sp. YR627]|uniref:glycosyltransferase family 2 protein n=1 Tax=Chitinophaga sp. YR627 TaxID=1881041 RepID=UPI0008EC1377|nr:glycosyltransferase [Chitinophaga sp. YR627]SFO58439.1 Glycosyltransferase involved in cell wall bisynthesis [Chitinophaga sp. YR627]
MNTTPSLSIITTVYNGLPYLKECIESVLKQDFQDWELLISDDCSKDGSRDYLDSLNDSRIKLYKQEKNLGIFDNLNFLFSKAGADVSLILCQDDYLVDNSSLDRVVAYWKNARKEVGFVKFNHAPKRHIIPTKIKAGEADVWFYSFGNFPGNLSNVSLRTNIVEASGWFNQQFPYAGDFEFWSRAARIYDVEIESTSVTYVRRHEGVASNFLNKKGELLSQRDFIASDLYERLLKQYPGTNFYLKLHGTLNYDVLHRDSAMRALLHKNKQFYNEFKMVSEKSKYTFSGLVNWMLFVLSVGGRYGRITTTKMLLKTCRLLPA